MARAGGTGSWRVTLKPPPRGLWTLLWAYDCGDGDAQGFDVYVGSVYAIGQYGAPSSNWKNAAAVNDPPRQDLTGSSLRINTACTWKVAAAQPR